MEQFEKAYPTADVLTQQASENLWTLPYQEDVHPLRQPLTLHGKTIPNRLLAQPIEGFDAQADGSPSQRTVRRYQALAAGGSGSLWMESVSVNHQGRSNPRQLWITSENVEAFRDMVCQIRAASQQPVYLILQLTHSGRNSNPDGIPTPMCAFHSQAIPKDRETILTDADLGALEEDYFRAAELARAAGFDAVDIRACHGYLINELFAAVDRPGKYGGSFENRIRLMMNIVERVQKIQGLEIGVRLNLFDGIPYPDGWGVNPKTGQMDLTEPLELVRRLYHKGVRLLNVSCGVGAYSPHLIRPYDRGGPEPPEPPLAGVCRLQECARLVKQEAPEALVVASGFSWLRQYASSVAAGGVAAGYYDLAGFGRQSIADTQYADHILTGNPEKISFCRCCCGCTTLIKKSGKQLRCVFRKEQEI